MPLKPSLPPNSKITNFGLCLSSNNGSLYKPPDVVSPLIPAFITVSFRFSFEMLD